MTVLAVTVCLAAAATARAESVAGETTIASANAGVVMVRLDKALHFDENSLPSAAFTGQGDWRAIALLGLHGSLMASGTPDSTYLGTSADLPKGDYQLYVATDDGIPVGATLTLPGLDGRADFVPSATVPVHAATPTPHTSDANPDTTVIGALAATEAGGMGVNRLKIDYAAPSAGRSQDCLYFDARSASAPDAFDVGCPGGFDDASLPTGYGDPFVAVTSEPGEPERFDWFLQSGAFGEGANVTAEGGAPTLSETSRWIDFGDDGQPVAPATASAPPAVSAPPPATPAPTVRCPAAPRRLPRTFRAGAIRVALGGRHGLRASAGRAAGADARRIAALCGRAALRRTAVVRLRGPGLIETAYVVRTRRGWRVWWSDRRQLAPRP